MYYTCTVNSIGEEEIESSIQIFTLKHSFYKYCCITELSIRVIYILIYNSV